MRFTIRHLLALVLISLVAVFVGAPASSALAQTKSLEWTRLDTDVTVLPNGDLQIKETNVIDFTSGTFTFGFRDIDPSRLTSVSNVRVTENGQPLRTEVSRTEDDKTRIKYYFSPASKQQRTFVLEYLVKGATRYYTGGDQVYWSGVYPDRNGFPVLNSRIWVNLPQGATATEVGAYGPKADVSGKGESKVVATALETIPSGEQFEIRVQFPHGIISGSAPAWQRSFDSQREYEEKTKPVVDMGFLLASLLVVLGGPAAVVVLYNARGKDPNVGLVADYLPEPPDIAPGVAGTLIDEKADMQDIIATLVDLARRGVVNMSEGEPDKTLGFVSQDFTFTRGPNFGQPGLLNFEQRLISGMGLHTSESVSLTDMKNRFYSKIPGLKQGLYDEVVTAGMYNHDPEKTRNKYTGCGVFLLVGAIFLGCVSFFVLIAASEFALCLPFGLGLTGVALLIAAPGMPLRTRKGAELKMRADAFKRYLQNVEKYTNLKEAQDKFDKYLPYAIAFGLERSWVNKFSQVNTPVPDWYVPYPGRPVIYGNPYGGHAYPRGAGGTVLGGLGSNPAGDISGAARAPGQGGLSGLDQSLTTGLSSISTGLTTMFSSVATTFTSVPAPPPSSGRSGGWSSGGGGGWSGGGGGGGGSSGGGGGGFG